MASVARPDRTISSQEGYPVEEIVSTSWDRRLADELIAELEACTGERPSTIKEMRKFLALKSYRELLERLPRARDGQNSHPALRLVADSMPEDAPARSTFAAGGP